MRTYFATFIPGFAEVVNDALKGDISDIKITDQFESSILFHTDKSYEKVAARIYLNNVFVVFNSFPLNNQKQNGSIVKELFKDSDTSVVTQLFAESRTFRFMIQKGSKLTHVPREFTKRIIPSISEQTHLTHNPLKADIEFWFFIRNEGQAILGVRSTKTSHQEVKEGQLRSAMAHLLNLLSEPKKEDVYLDPFTGYGALPLDRAQHFPYTHLYISDVDEKLVHQLLHLVNNKKDITIKQADALKLNYLPDKSINKIVTDPPWGIYQMQNINYEDFYIKMLTEMIRVIKEKGVIVIITSKTTEFESALSRYKDNLSLQKTFTTLVNGKKASVYKLRA